MRRKNNPYMHRYSYKIIARNDAMKNDGTIPLYLQVFVNSDRVRINLFLYVKPNEWNEDKQCVISKGKKDENQINQVIESLKIRVSEIFFNARLSPRGLTKESFLRELYKPKQEEMTFESWIRYEMDNRTGLVAASTQKTYKRTLSYVKDTIKDVLLIDFDLDLIEKIEKKMKKDNLHTNTRYGIHKHLKLFLNAAVKRALITRNPYVDFKAKKSRTTRVFLNIDEVIALYEYYQLNKPNEILRIYLGMVFTSLRVQDAMDVKYEQNIIDDVLVFQPLKTKDSLDTLHIPLTIKAKEIIGEGKGNIFKKFEPQYINRELKKIATLAGVNKEITCHTARHTFANLFLQAGGKIERLKDIMGHSKIETTMVYTHVNLEDKKESMSKLNEFYKF